jgi:MYXO-CTERM domain-containing protein
MEFQMRNKTFISSMVLSVACVSAANAGVVDPFTAAQTAIGTTAALANFMDITGGLFEQRTLSKVGGGSGSIANASGLVNFVPFNEFRMTYRQKNGASIDLSGITSMSFDITASGTFEVQWVITDSTGIAIDHEIGVVSGSTTVTFNSFIGTGANLGFNMASIQMMEVKFVDGSAGSTGQISNFNYTGVPAPGALALLGVAGIVGARRRRA